MIQWATVLFYFSVEEVFISSVFSEYGGAKVLNARIFLFYRRCAADFCSAPPNVKNQKVDRFIKRLQRKIKLFPWCTFAKHFRFHRESRCSCWFWYNRKSLLRGQNRRKRHRTRAFEVKYWTLKALVWFIQLLISAVPKSSRTVWCKPCGVRISE